jgi:hypothetical protein
VFSFSFPSVSKGRCAYLAGPFWVIRVTLAVGRLLPVVPPEADIVAAGRHVSRVPTADVPSHTSGAAMGHYLPSVGPEKARPLSLPLAYLFHCVLLRGSSAGLM